MFLSFMVFIMNLLIRSFFINLAMGIFALLFTLKCNLNYFQALNSAEKQLLSLYPVLLFYTFICLFISMIWFATVTFNNNYFWSFYRKSNLIYSRKFKNEIMRIHLSIYLQKITSFDPIQTAILTSRRVCSGSLLIHWSMLQFYSI